MGGRTIGGHNGRITSGSIIPISQFNPQALAANATAALINEIRRALDGLFANLFPWYANQYWSSSPHSPGIRSGFEGIYPIIDLVDQGDYYVIRAELPRFNKEMIDVQVNERCLLIRGELKGGKNQKEPNYIHNESFYSAFRRTVTLPEEIIPSKGTMKDGVLELVLLKKEPLLRGMRRVELK